jgi:hypothetical protein
MTTMSGGLARGAGADAAASGKLLLAREVGEWPWLWWSESGETTVVAVVVAVFPARRRVLGDGGGWKEERRRWWEVRMREGVDGARMAGVVLVDGSERSSGLVGV